MTTPYIGSKISLISQLDIRYEGFLHKVDPIESTISLSRVRSFGTEDRLASVMVPERKEVYDYIIFKASDIKDLIVCDTPKPTPDVDDITYDPAIISVSKPTNIMSSSIEDRNAFQDSKTSSPYGRGQLDSRHQQSTEFSKNEQAISGGFGQSHRQSYQLNTIQRQHQPSHKYSSMRQEPRVFQSQKHQLSHQQQQRHYRGGDHRTRHQHYYYNQHTHVGKKYDDFDFEKANEDFLESVDEVVDNMAQIDLEHSDSQLSLNNDNSPTQEIDGELNNEKAILIHEKPIKNDVYYDKSRSFFDNISCEATEREAGKNNRVDWKKERMTNEVTFGPAAVRMHNFQRRGSRGDATSILRRGYFYNNQRRNYGAGLTGGINSSCSFERLQAKQSKEAGI